VTASTAAGIANLALLAPAWMQLVHLALADLTWIALVALAARVFRPEETGP
jgi:cytochrome c oxidase assembly protein subunit 15